MNLKCNYCCVDFVSARSSLGGRLAVAALGLVLMVSPVPVLGQSGGAAPRGGAESEQASVASLFDDFLHYSILGRFDQADGYGKQLLAHPDLDPVAVLRLSEQNDRAMETLVILVNNTKVGDSAVKILDLIREGEHRIRKDVDRIKHNIERLGGPPQAEYHAIAALTDSGEYAVPWLIQALADESRGALWPRIVRALPRLGKGAVNPLVEALAVSDERIRLIVIDTLADIGYEQAVPYLLAVSRSESVSPGSRDAALAAVTRIERRAGRPLTRFAAEEFYRLGERFYDEDDSVRADTRLDRANVWSWNNRTEFLDFASVPREIFGPVMAMRCCTRALAIDPGHTDSVALWLAANIRREARLGLNVENDDASESPREVDPTRPEGFPRALYFTSAVGPRYAHLVLRRAVADVDAPVALGAVAALSRTAGPSSLVGLERYSSAFLEALRFPDLVVRTRAALALGRALPRVSFRGAELVIPTLAGGMALTGGRNVLLVDEDDDRRNRLAAELRRDDTRVVTESNVLDGLERSSAEMGLIQAIVLSSRVRSPDLGRSMETIRGRYDLSLVPVVMLADPADLAGVAALESADAGVGHVDAGAGAALVMARLAEIESRIGQTPVDATLARQIALQCARVVRDIAMDGRSVFDPSGAESACAGLLGASDEALQRAGIEDLSLLGSPTAQRVLASMALDESVSEALRLAAFEALADSAKRFGNQLDEARVEAVLGLATSSDNLRLRTAASRAVGALNLVAERASRIPLMHDGG